MRLSIVALLTVCGLAAADVTLDGPASIPRDSFGEWRLTGDRVDQSSFLWNIEPIQENGAPTVRAHASRFSADQDSLLFVGGPGKYRFRVIVVGPSGNDRRPFSMQQIERIVEVVDSDPLPPPLPPDRQLPVGKYGLIRSSYQSVIDNVPADARSSAKDLAQSFRTMVETIKSMQAAGAPVVPVQVLAQARTQNGAALGANRDKWIEWAKKLEVQLKALNAEGKLLTADSYKEVFTEIATGLEAVK